MTPDTSAEATRGAAALLRALSTQLMTAERLKMAAMLEALAAERDATNERADAWVAAATTWEDNCRKLLGRLDAAIRERDAARAEAERMREALEGCEADAWGLRGRMGGLASVGCEAVARAIQERRAALAAKEPGHE